MSELETKSERLKAEATERWGDRWYLDIAVWSDDSFQAYAVRSRGRNDDGHLVKDRLIMNEDGDTAVERLTIERRELETKTIEPPASST